MKPSCALKIGAIILILATSMTLFFGNADPGGDACPFSVDPVYPAGQVEPDAGYWYVDTSSGKAVELAAKVRNIGGKGITVSVEPADCYTSTGGDLCYITDNKNPAVALADERFLLAKSISLPEKSFKLQAGETRTFKFSLTSPDVEAGEVLGGIRFFVTIPGKGAGNVPGGGGTQLNLNIKNAVTITVRLRYKPAGDSGKPGFSIGDAGFDPDAGAPYFWVVNNLPAINRDARGSYDVYDSRKKRLFGGSFDMVRMAPESMVRLPVKWAYSSAEPGEYSVYVRSGNASKPEARTFRLGSGDNVTIVETEPPGAVPGVPTAASDGKLLIYGGWILFGVTLALMIVFLPIKRKKRN